MVDPQTTVSASAVTIRPAGVRDAELLMLWRSEPSVARYQPLGSVTIEQVRTELATQDHVNLHNARGDKFQWIIQHHRQPVGWITLVATNWQHGLAEIGYALSTPFQRQGITPPALRRLLADLFLRTRLQRIEARCATGNIGSRRVLEMIGFQKEGLLRDYFVLRGKRVDNYLYAILRNDFLPRLDR